MFSLFAFVAASDLLGLSLHLRGFEGAVFTLWLVALSVWLVMTYCGFAVLAFRNAEGRPDVVQGAWLIGIVGTQSLVALGAALAPKHGAAAPLRFLLSHALWGVGLSLYGVFIVLFCHRIFFRAIAAEDLTPVLWIVMGAAAISVSAGSMLLLADIGMPFLRTIRPFVPARRCAYGLGRHGGSRCWSCLGCGSTVRAAAARCRHDGLRGARRLGRHGVGVRTVALGGMAPGVRKAHGAVDLTAGIARPEAFV